MRDQCATAGSTNHDGDGLIKTYLKVNWNEGHREDVNAAVRVAVRRVLANRSVKAEDFEPFVARCMEQAQVLYENWPIAA
jgi:hypothetical protein